MPRSGGVYTLPAGNPVVTLTTISSTWANNTMSDIALALTGSLPTDGSAAMTGDLKLADGVVGAPGLTWATEPTSGWYRIGSQQFGFSVASTLALSVNMGNWIIPSPAAGNALTISSTTGTTAFALNLIGLETQTDGILCFYDNTAAGIAGCIGFGATITGQTATDLSIFGRTGVTIGTPGGNAILARFTNSVLFNGTTSVVGDTAQLRVYNTALTSSLCLSTLKGWTGAGSDVADFVVGSTGLLYLCANNNNSPSAQIDVNGNFNVPMSYGGATLAPVFSGIPSSAANATRVTAAADSNTCLYTTTAAITLTITGGVSAHPVGVAITFINRSSGNITIAISTDSMFWTPSGTTGSRTLAQYGEATAYHVSAGVWFISGTGLT
jgi:hypothetical protein